MDTPDSIPGLLDVLCAHPLDDFWLLTGVEIPSRESGAVRFWGNFADLAHVFDVETTDSALIERLRAGVDASLALAQLRSGLSLPDFAAQLADRALVEAERAEAQIHGDLDQHRAMAAIYRERAAFWRDRAAAAAQQGQE